MSDHGATFNRIHIAAAFMMLGNILQRSHKTNTVERTAAAELISKLSDLALSQIGSFGAQAVSNTMYSLSKLPKMGFRTNPELFTALTLHGSQLLQEFTPQQLSNTIWALATLSHHDNGFTADLISAARRKLPVFIPQNFSNTIWALATLGHHHDGFTAALISEAQGQLPLFNPQNLANTIWALATLGHHDDGFTAALISEARAKLSSFKPQELANTIWALATLGHHDLSLIHISEPTRPY